MYTVKVDTACTVIEVCIDSEVMNKMQVHSKFDIYTSHESFCISMNI